MDAILAREAPAATVCCRECQATNSKPKIEDLYRCLYCLTHPIYCAEHMAEIHQLTPFHRIEKWTGTHFNPSWLTETGLKISLGHNGFHCPAHDPVVFSEAEDIADSEDEGVTPQQEEDLTTKVIDPIFSKGNRCWIVDVSGIHSMEVVFCGCVGARAKHQQLLDMDLWPASFKRIKTLFTFRLLSDFRLDNLEAKTSAYHYFTKLRRITCPADPDTVPVSWILKPPNRLLPTSLRGELILLQDRYRELIRVARQWRVVLLRKWRGFGHKKEEQPSSGSLALFCPSCPQPGINLPEDWESHRKRSVIHIFFDTS